MLFCGKWEYKSKVFVVISLLYSTPQNNQTIFVSFTCFLTSFYHNSFLFCSTLNTQLTAWHRARCLFKHLGELRSAAQRSADVESTLCVNYVASGRSTKCCTDCCCGCCCLLVLTLCWWDWPTVSLFTAPDQRCDGGCRADLERCFSPTLRLVRTQRRVLRFSTPSLCVCFFFSAHHLFAVCLWRNKTLMLLLYLLAADLVSLDWPRQMPFNTLSQRAWAEV